MIRVEVDPGICGLTSTITVTSEDMMTAAVTIESQCEDIQNIGKELQSVNGMEEVFKKHGESIVAKLGNKYCRHATCPVPGALLKGIEAACGLALPKDVHIEITKQD
jgi:hypothetical protein